MLLFERNALKSSNSIGSGVFCWQRQKSLEFRMVMLLKGCLESFAVLRVSHSN